MADDMIHLGHGSQHLKLDLAGRQKGWGRWCHWSEHAYSGGLACGSSVRTRFGNTEWAWAEGDIWWTLPAGAWHPCASRGGAAV